MSREIKFEFLYKGLPFDSKTDDCNWFKKVYTLDDFIEKSLRELSDVHDQATLIAKRQFTGSTDTEGTEIYDGDWLEDVEEHFYYDVTWSESFGGWTADGEALADLLGDIKVIGNIHQNPELLR